MLERLRKLKNKWIRFLDGFEARRLASCAGLVFTTNYHLQFLGGWERHLASFRGREGVRFLEIGSFEGRSALWFVENILTHPTAKIVCIDPFFRLNRELRYAHNVRVSGYTGKIETRKGLSQDILPHLSAASFDMIYIDGSHLARDVLMDAMLGWRLLKRGGIMMFDDYGWDTARSAPDRPQMAIDLFLETLPEQLEVLHHDYQVIIRKR